MKKAFLTLATIFFLHSANAQAIKDCTKPDRWLFAFCSPKAGKAQLTITDTTGKIEYSAKVKVFEGFNTPVFYSSKFTKGIHIVTIQGIYTTTITIDNDSH